MALLNYTKLFSFFATSYEIQRRVVSVQTKYQKQKGEEGSLCVET